MLPPQKQQQRQQLHSSLSGNVFIVDKRSICQVKLALAFLLGSSIIKKMFITSSADPKSEYCCRIANAKMMFGKQAITSVCEDAVQVLPVLSLRDERVRGFFSRPMNEQSIDCRCFSFVVFVDVLTLLFLILIYYLFIYLLMNILQFILFYFLVVIFVNLLSVFFFFSFWLMNNFFIIYDIFHMLFHCCCVCFFFFSFILFNE